MSKNVKVIVLRTAGTNCDQEVAFAFQNLGAQVDLVHINRLFKGEVKLEQYHILVVPGGFTYGDDIISGRLLANELREKLGADIVKFINDQKLIIGICNGFQVLVRAGLLPGPVEQMNKWSAIPSQTTSLTYNDSGKFEDRWIHLKKSGSSVWTEGLEDIIFIPVAHGEGKFVVQNEALLENLKKNGQIIFRYCTKDGSIPQYPEDPNGSLDHIAGISDKSGRILGLMPHPERHFLFTQHPFWTRLESKAQYGQGARIFLNGINYVKKKFLGIKNPTETQMAFV